MNAAQIVGQLQTKENKTNSLMTKAHVKINMSRRQFHPNLDQKRPSRKVGCSSDSIPTRILLLLA